MAAAAKALDVSDELARVVESGDVEALARLLPRVADLNARNRHGTTVLMKAASCGHAQIVRLLLEYGADPNLTRNDKFTALALAAFFGHTETVQTLLEFGAHTEDVTRSGASARTWARARTFAEVARCLDAPAPRTQSRISIQKQLRPSMSRTFVLGVMASVIVIVCCGLGALVLRSSEAHDLPIAPSQPPQKVEPPKVVENVVTPPPEPELPAPNTVVSEAVARPTIRKAAALRSEAKSLPVLNEKPVEQLPEKVQLNAPIAVLKPKSDPPKPAPLSPQIIAPSKKGKVIQWP